MQEQLQIVIPENVETEISQLLNEAQVVFKSNENDLETLKNSTWYKRLFEAVTFQRKQEQVMVRNIARLTDLQRIVTQVMLVVAQKVENVSALVVQNAKYIDELFEGQLRTQNEIGQLRDSVITLAEKTLKEFNYIKSGYKKSYTVSDLKDNEKFILVNVIYKVAEAENLTSDSNSQDFMRILMAACDEYNANGDFDFAILEDLGKKQAEVFYTAIVDYLAYTKGAIDFGSTTEEVVDNLSISGSRKNSINEQTEKLMAAAGKNILLDKYDTANDDISFIELEDDMIALLEANSSENVCPACGTPLKDDAKFCSNCGAKVDGDAASGDDGNMVLIQGGMFMMGSDRGKDYEKPVHSVTVSSFRICKYQVTQGDWEKIMEDNPSYFRNEPARGEDQWLRPVECVSWYDAIKYCNKRSVAEGLTPCYAIDGSTDKVSNGTPKIGDNLIDLRWDNVTCDWNADGYRLPTEAEWEYAARGGGMAAHQTDYSGGYNIDEVAWYKGNSGNRTHQVGLKAPNAAGLYDMSGNVAEWCWDWNGRYSSEAQNDPHGPDKTLKTLKEVVFRSDLQRIWRGGMWKFNADFCCVWFRFSDMPDYWFDNIGLRVCRRA